MGFATAFAEKSQNGKTHIFIASETGEKWGREGRGEREKRNLLVLQARELPSGSYLPQRELLNSL